MSLLLVDELPPAAAPERRSWDVPAEARWRPAPVPAPRREDDAMAVREAAEPLVAKPRKTAGSRIADLALTLAALLGLVILGITVTAHFTGLRPLVVKSGSMEPTIPTGGMVLVRTIPASAIQPDDIVAVERPDRTRVTHRVLKVEQQGETAALTLKGDANEDPDPLPVTVAEAGKLVLSAPSIGRVSAFLASAKGGFVLGCLFTMVALPVVRRREPAS